VSKGLLAVILGLCITLSVRIDFSIHKGLHGFVKLKVSDSGPSFSGLRI
jgi:hypothetical protein